MYAAKEVIQHAAMHEYRLLHELARLGTPAVEPLAVVTGRTDVDGEPLDPVLLTRHLRFSLPYRSLFSMGVRPDTVTRLVDAMVVLLVRLHLIGFMWGDVSLSNVLFRRDAGEYAAYLVDAETGELHDKLTDGQRLHDLQIATVNLFGEFSDLEAGRILVSGVQPRELVSLIETRYLSLWKELTGVEEFSGSELHRIEHRVRRLNSLGFDIAELTCAPRPGPPSDPTQGRGGGHHRAGCSGSPVWMSRRTRRGARGTTPTRTGADRPAGRDEAVVAHQY